MQQEPAAGNPTGGSGGSPFGGPGGGSFGGPGGGSFGGPGGGSFGGPGGGSFGGPRPGPGGPTGPGGRPRRRGFIPRRKVCQFCVDKVDKIDYKDFRKLGRYISERGKIEPRRKTGTCARHQRTLTVALKRARHIALLPFTGAHMREPAPYIPRS